jgi:hypothetical protein
VFGADMLKEVHDLFPVNLKLSQSMFCIASLDGFFTKSVAGDLLLLTTGGLINVMCPLFLSETKKTPLP